MRSVLAYCPLKSGESFLEEVLPLPLLPLIPPSWYPTPSLWEFSRLSLLLIIIIMLRGLFIISCASPSSSESLCFLCCWCCCRWRAKTSVFGEEEPPLSPFSVVSFSSSSGKNGGFEEDRSLETCPLSLFSSTFLTSWEDDES